MSSALRRSPRGLSVSCKRPVFDADDRRRRRHSTSSPERSCPFARSPRPAAAAAPCRRTTCPAPLRCVMLICPVSCVGMKPVGTSLNSTPVSNQHEQREDHRQRAMPHRPLERHAVLVEQPVVRLLGRLVESSVLLVLLAAEEAARQHRRERQRHDARHENRRRDDDRELAEQPTDDPAEKEQRE